MGNEINWYRREEIKQAAQRAQAESGGPRGAVTVCTDGEPAVLLAASEVLALVEGYEYGETVEGSAKDADYWKERYEAEQQDGWERQADLEELEGEVEDLRAELDTAEGLIDALSEELNTNIEAAFDSIDLDRYEADLNFDDADDVMREIRRKARVGND